MPDPPFSPLLPGLHRYRALLLNTDGKILRVRSITAEDDDKASDIARGMLDGRAVELWDRNRFIKRFGPTQA